MFTSIYNSLHVAIYPHEFYKLLEPQLKFKCTLQIHGVIQLSTVNNESAAKLQTSLSRLTNYETTWLKNFWVKHLWEKIWYLNEQNLWFNILLYSTKENLSKQEPTYGCLLKQHDSFIVRNRNFSSSIIPNESTLSTSRAHVCFLRTINLFLTLNLN